MSYKIFSGLSNEPLADEICKILKIQKGKIKIGRFPDGEIEIKVLENVRGIDTFVIQSIAGKPNEYLMELLLIIDTLKRASARSITAVIPYFGYARQDRKPEPRVPISAKLVANLIAASGANRVLTLELHAGQIQGFFDIPVDHLYANPVMFEYFKSKNLKNLVVVSPDAGGAERARVYAKILKADLAIIDKRRISGSDIEVLNVIGDVKNKNVLIVDDLIDTAGTLEKASKALKENGARNIYVSAAHGIFSGNAVERIKNSDIEEIVVTNSINIQKKIPKVRILSIARLMSEAIKRIYENRSISELFI